jgi:hypothetical protein
LRVSAWIFRNLFTLFLPEKDGKKGSRTRD